MPVADGFPWTIAAVRVLVHRCQERTVRIFVKRMRVRHDAGSRKDLINTLR